MKHNYQHIIKKIYSKPVIEEVMMDNEISIVMASAPPGDPGDDDPEDPEFPGVSQNTYKSSNSVDYGSSTYRSASTPFEK